MKDSIALEPGKLIGIGVVHAAIFILIFCILYPLAPSHRTHAEATQFSAMVIIGSAIAQPLFLWIFGKGHQAVKKAEYISMGMILAAVICWVIASRIS